MNRSGVQEPVLSFAPRHYICRRAKQKLIPDGRLNKPFWAEANWTEAFVDIEGDRKQRPSKQTRVKMLWDDEYFYVGAELLEDQIWATLTERDSVIFHDNDFEIFIDPDGDTHLYYELEINALNTVWDLLLAKPYRDGGPPVNGWDIAGLRTAVHIDGELNRPGAANKGWSVEAAIPWAALRECAAGGCAPLPGEFWRVNFSRVNWELIERGGGYEKAIDPATGKAYPEHNWVWSPMGLINMHYPELWGYVVFAGEEGPTFFELPREEIVKWELRKLYYRQRSYAARHGEYCPSLESLTGDDKWSIEPRIELTGDGFILSARSTEPGKILYVREDGLIWKG